MQIHSSLQNPKIFQIRPVNIRQPSNYRNPIQVGHNWNPSPDKNPTPQKIDIKVLILKLASVY